MGDLGFTRDSVSCVVAGGLVGHGFNREAEVVGGVLFFAKAEFEAEAIENRDGLANVAGRAVANLDDVFALGLKGEVFIESGGAIKGGFANTSFLRKNGKSFAGNVALLFLDVLRKGDNGFRLAIMRVDNAVDHVEINRCTHKNPHRSLRLI